MLELRSAELAHLVVTFTTPDGKSPFHEAWECLGTAKRELFAVNSLNQAGTYAVVNGCENALRTLYETATGEGFPHPRFRDEWHKPAPLARAIGAFDFYSPETQNFLTKYEGANLADVRFEDSQAYRAHVSPKAAPRAKELVEGAERLVRETEEMAARPEVLDAVRGRRRR